MVRWAVERIERLRARVRVVVVVRFGGHTLYRSQNRKSPTIGVLLDWVANSYQAELLEVLRSAAASASVNLLCFVGGALPRDRTAASARHQIYELCGRHSVDGVLLLSSTLTSEVGQAGLSEYCARFAPLPICSIGVELSVGSSVLVDNETGMREGLLHLIRDHGSKRIAFIRGPSANSEAASRLAAYKEALAQSGIPFEPELVLNGDFLLPSGREAVQSLFDRYGSQLPGIDAIAASNDAMAAGALAALEENSIAAPERIRILGFDDVEDARLTRPPLTTLKQPLEKQARHALRAVLDAIQFASEPTLIRLPTELVKRRSCGCQGAVNATRQSGTPEPRLSFEATLMMRRQRIIDSLTRTGRGHLGAAGHDWAIRLFNAIVSDSRSSAVPAFPAALQEIAEIISARKLDLDLCDELIDVLRDHVLASTGNVIEIRNRLEHSFHQGRVIVRRAATRGLMREHLLLARRGRALNAACSALGSAFDLAELATLVRNELPRLDIECCLVALHDADGGPQSARLLTGYDRRTGRHWTESRPFDPKTLLPLDLLRSDDTGRSFFVLPLVWHQRLLGHALFEQTPESAFACGAIASALSAAVWGAKLAGSTKVARTNSAIPAAPVE